MVEYSYIGKSLPRVDGRAKVTGEAVYTADIQLPGLLVGKIKRSPYPFARIININTSRAQKLAGVRAVITAGDITQFPYGPMIADELPLADGHVRYAGEGVAAVAAIDDETAAEALDLIEVEYEELTPALDPEEAMAPGAPVVHPERETVKLNVAYSFDFARGEGEAAFRQADLVVADRFSTQAQYQAYLEPQACIAQWHDSGKLTVWGALQAPFRARTLLALALGIPEHQIRIVQPYIGGGFGGKLYLQPNLPICALLARQAGRPVKLVYTREEDFISGRPRISEIIDLRLGFKGTTLVAKSVRVTADCGAYCGCTPAVVATSLVYPDNLYRLANTRASASIVYTNKIPRSACRGFGNLEMLFATESLMDVAAERLGIDPAELRLKNCAQKGDVTAHGWVLNSCGLSDSILLATEKSRWTDWKWKRNRGMGMACQVHISGKKAMHPLYDGSAAIVSLDQLGKVKVISGESELGQGANTVFAQIAAEELGIDAADIEVLPVVDSDFSPYCIGTAASRVTMLGGNAVRLAARDARRQLLKYAAAKLGIGADELQIRDGRFYVKASAREVATVKAVANDIVLSKLGGVPITGRAEYIVPDDVVMPDKTQYGNCSVGYAFSTQVAEVEVDTETGKVEVLNVWVGEDVGKALNPGLCEGQIEGGVVQGIGYALSEDYYWKEGRLLTTDFRDYKLPVFAGIPEIHSILIETNEPAGPFGAKSIGEPAINPTAAAIANAVYDAVGVRIKALPITPEKLLQALKDKGKKKP
ncbi:MAG: xanthine dehydrogenase family protein molybdopterin-binding subunit [Chloroflexota bacterium]|nr:xanthine dehydrogenase family protein molybdopterin-binding subunit [Chloroflexota bacterium]